jgi:hypothetical protein
MGIREAKYDAVWALLLAHDMIAGLADRAAVLAGLAPGEIAFTAVLSRDASGPPAAPPRSGEHGPANLPSTPSPSACETSSKQT